MLKHIFFIVVASCSTTDKEFKHEDTTEEAKLTPVQGEESLSEENEDVHEDLGELSQFEGDGNGEESVYFFNQASSGKWQKTEAQIKRCEASKKLKRYPFLKVWHYFSPFFEFQWNDEFKAFSSLLLAIWEQETRFMIPGEVIINSNCKGKVVTTASLESKQLRKDLKESTKKDKEIKKKLGKCDLSKADFGPLQWNYHWRLNKAIFRPYLEKALLLTTSYTEKEIKNIKDKDLPNLIKYNSKALFVLGGLYIKDELENPKRIIANYNKKKSYHEKVNNRRNFFWKQLKQLDSCIVQDEVPEF